MEAPREEYVVDNKGKKRAVIVRIEKYERLLEDIHDLAIVAERRDEEPVSLHEVKLRLRKDGIL
ncbi:MAG: type II toxin-antitoxin system Phd/YefM family antitoxin [Chloroflexi bacterium]|nr:type II toxin-antitoxin system Phd/YefM family antitoxin [Chloroflexota bacterium]